MQARGRRSALIGAAFALLLAPVAIAALAGDLDSSFDGDGKQILNVGGADGVNAVAIQPDGKIVVVGGFAGEFALARFNPNGSLDTGFGNDGIPADGVSRTHMGGEDVGRGVAIQPDGKIVVAGQAVIAGPTGSNLALARYNSDGSLDMTFGDDATLNDGKFTVDLGGTEDVGDVALDGDKIVVVGTRSDDLLVSRHLSSGGELDTTFNPATGWVATDMDVGSVDRGQSVLIQSSNRILAGGSAGASLALARYAVTGVPDTSFGNDGTPADGKVVFDDPALDFPRAADLALTPGGKIVTGGDHTGAYLVARFNDDGSPDTSFSGDGWVVDPLIGGNGGARGVAVQPDGKVLLAGAGGGDFALLRYTSGGVLDPSFSGDGIATADFGGSDSGSEIALQGDGRVVVAGVADDPNGDFALARFLTVDDPAPPAASPPATKKRCKKGFRLKKVKTKKGRKKKKCVRKKKRRRR